MNIEHVVRGYVVAMLWSSNDNDRDPEGGGIPLDRNYDANDLTPEANARVRTDCEQFVRLASGHLDEYLERIVDTPHYDANEGTPEDYAGHDLWLTRAGHGVGFWDRGLGDLGDVLTEVCKRMGDGGMPWGDEQGRVHID